MEQAAIDAASALWPVTVGGDFRAVVVAISGAMREARAGWTPEKIAEALDKARAAERETCAQALLRAARETTDPRSFVAGIVHDPAYLITHYRDL